MSNNSTPDAIIEQQIAYYRARAGEYDEWFTRRGRYDRGDAHTQAWRAEAGIVERALEGAAPLGRCLELACGTGLFTRHLAGLSEQVTALDASPEVIAVNSARVGADNVRYRQADLFAWRPDAAYDFVFFSFWLSHVPEDRFNAFWETVRGALAPGGRVFLIDSLFDPGSTARDHKPPDKSGIVERKLNDGQAFQIVKLFYEPDELNARLARLGWSADLRASGQFFLYGEARPVTA